MGNAEKRELYMGLTSNTFGYLEMLPKASKDDLAAYYNAKDFNNDAADNPYSTSYADEEILHKQIDAAECSHFAPADHKRLLDIGCDEGFFLDAFGKRGFRVRGLDFTPVLPRHARRRRRNPPGGRADRGRYGQPDLGPFQEAVVLLLVERARGCPLLSLQPQCLADGPGHGQIQGRDQSVSRYNDVLCVLGEKVADGSSTQPETDQPLEVMSFFERWHEDMLLPLRLEKVSGTTSRWRAR
jgi:hypothetical protein